MLYGNQIHALVIITLLLILFTSGRILNLKGRLSFLRTLVIVFLCATLDLLLNVALQNWAVSNPTLTIILSRSFLISMILVHWNNFSYVSLDLNSSKKKHSMTVGITGCIAILFAISVIFTPLEIVEIEKGIFETTGVSLLLTYIFVGLFVLFTIVVAFYVYLKTNKRRGFAVLLSELTFIVGAVVQILLKNVHIISLSTVIGVVILYIVMENPDAQIDRSLGCYSSSAFLEYLDYLNDKKTNYFIVDVSITSLTAVKSKNEKIEVEIYNAIHDLWKKRKISVFRTFNFGIGIVTKDKDTAMKIARQILFIAYKNEIKKNIHVQICSNLHVFDSETIVAFLLYSRKFYNDKKGELVYLNENDIDSFIKLEQINKAIDQALYDDRVEVFFQPIYSIKNKSFEIAECLCRIRNKDGSYLSPGAFIPIAEATGSITRLGKRIYEKVCEFIYDNDLEKYGIKYLDVNLSAVQCSNKSLAEDFIFIANTLGINPNYINFEITETAIAEDRANLVANMNALIDRGFSFSLDDFGKGASNIMYAVELPVNMIKIDMDLTKLYFSDKKAKLAVDSIIDMSHKMNIKLVSEGVETKEEVEKISDASFDYIQGFYYSRPLRKEEFIDFLEKQKDKVDSLNS